MKLLKTHAPSVTMRQVASAFLIAPLCLLALPAFAQHDDGRGRGNAYGHGDHHDRNDHDDRGRDRKDDRYRGNHYGRDYSYAQPVYVPAPVYRQPRPSPGISIFLPLDLRR